MQPLALDVPQLLALELSVSASGRIGTVVATAGNEDKRALAQLMGADLVLDSRSLAFADEIRWQMGGVDVVLNSLSGDAMRRSLRALKPFGRFIELGKRDFVADTAVGARRVYQLNPNGVAALRVYFDGFWNRALEAFKDAAERQTDEEVT